MPGLLPPSAGFPVFGLASGQLEPRWLELWDTWRPWSEQVWRVCLGHGDPTHAGPRVIVTTVPRLPRVRLGDVGDVTRGPTRADDAIGWAQQSMLHAVAPDFPPGSPDRQEWWRSELDLAAWLSRHPGADEWEPLELPLDGRSQPFRLRRHGPAWAAFAEVETGWIAVDGIHTDPAGLALAEVSAADYAMTAA